MLIENLGSILSLLCIVVGLLYCIFKYVETPMPGFKFLIAFFLGNFLSEYYWTTYEIVMHSYPHVSGLLAYLGWNVGYLMLALAVNSMRHDGARRLIHPILLVPVVANVAQFFLYITYGGILNNLWEVGLTTLTMVFCLQEMVHYLRHRKEGAVFPLFFVLVFVHLCLHYGMWTSSCFDWGHELANPYVVCLALAAVVSLYFGYGAKRYYEAEGSITEARSASELRFHVLIQTIVALVVIAICVGGFITVFAIKNYVQDTTGFLDDEAQIVAFLFTVSVILVLVVLVPLFLLSSQYRTTLRNIREMKEGSRSRINFIVTTCVTLALMAFAVVYNSVVVYDASVVSVYEDGGAAIKSYATDLENYLTVAQTTLRVAADSVDLMLRDCRPIEDVTDYIVDQTTIQSEQFDENFTGLYAYIDGQYLDGLRWEPPADYEPTSRNWYKDIAGTGGKVHIVSPYLDAQTGSIVITIGKEISASASAQDEGSHNIVCLDVIVSHIQDATQAVDIAEKGYGMVVNDDGFIIAHSDSSLNGKNLADLFDRKLLDDIKGAKEGFITATIDGEESTLFVSEVMGQWHAVIAIRNSELFEDTWSQLVINILVSLITFCLISFFYYIGYKNEQISSKKVEEMNIQVVSALAAAIDAKDTYTNGHSSRVADYSRMIAARSGCTKAEQDEIYLMGLLHDVGKIGVPDEVINKTSRLTDEEFELIKEHPVIGNGILASIQERPKLATGARWHHERYGGGGYPDGISGEEIPAEARIIAVADAYDAMTSNRSYRGAMPQDKVRSEIERGMGTQFDPKYARVMLQMIDEDRDYSMRER